MPDSEPASALKITIADGGTEGTALPELPQPSAVGSALRPAVKGRRFSVREVIGRGATSQVFATLDNDLEREVAIKVLRLPQGPEQWKRFLHEARITAQLEHPNIPPVYDIGVTTNRELYLALRRIGGRSLQDVIDTAIGEGRGEIMPVNDLVTIFIKICDAVAFAHAQGVLHQDIKPDNVMISGFGGVMVVDWGTATPSGPLQAGLLVGTPAYMSPEQARAELPSPANDVYAIGASLFQCLLLRLPLEEQEVDRFWLRKKQGELDPPTAAELGRSPRPLVAIAMKAMAERARRYPDIAALAADLRHFQAGMAVTAFAEPLLVRLLRWHRRHARVLWPIAVAAFLVAILGLVLWRERAKEQALWGPPLLAETFADDTWKDRWKIHGPGRFSASGGVLSCAGAQDNVLLYHQRLDGPVAIEFEAMIPEGCQPGDISAVWTEADAWETTYPSFSDGHARAFRFQVGAFDNLFSAIYRSPDDGHLALANGPVAVGAWHRIRAEVDGELVSLTLDGKLVGQHREILACTSGYIGLFGYHAGKLFRNVRIWHKGVAEKVGIIGVGEALLAAGDPGKAAAQFRRIAESHPGTPLADEARFKEGVARQAAQQDDEADAAWARIGDAGLLARAQAQRLDTLVRRDEHAAAVAGFRQLYGEWPDLRPQLREQWIGYLMSGLWQGPGRLDPYLGLWRQLFPDDQNAGQAAGSALYQLGRFDEVLRDVPTDALQCINALFALGRPEEAERRFPQVPFVRGDARMMRGEFADILREDPANLAALLATGRIDDALLAAPDKPLPLLYAGRPQAAMDLAPGNFAVRSTALRMLGRAEEAAAVPHNLEARLALDRPLEALQDQLHPYNRYRVLIHHALLAHIRGDAAGCARLRNEAEALAYNRIRQPQWFERRLLFPLLAAFAGDPGPWQRALAETARAGEAAQRPRFAVRRLQGAISDADFLAQPCAVEAPAWMKLCDGIRRDLAGDAAGARAAYADFLALPLQQRCLDGIDGDATIDRLVHWRMLVLKGP